MANKDIQNEKKETNSLPDLLASVKKGQNDKSSANALIISPNCSEFISPKPLGSLEDVVIRKLLSNHNFRDVVNDFHNRFPEVMSGFIEKVVKDKTLVDDFFLLYFGLDSFRKKHSIWELYTRIENYESRLCEIFKKIAKSNGENINVR